MSATKRQSRQRTVIARSLRAVKDRIRIVTLADGLLLMLAAGLLLLLVTVAGDHLVTGGLSVMARAVMRWLMTAVELAMLGGLLAWPLARPISDVYAARLIERAHPALRNDLTSALELADDPTVAPGALAALRRRVASELAVMDPGSAVGLRPLRVSATVLASAAGLAMLFALVTPKPVLPSIARAMGRELPPPTHARIVAVEPPPNTVVVTGQLVDFAADVAHPAETPVLRISRDNGHTFLAEDTFAMTPAETPAGDPPRFTAQWTAVADPAAGSVAAFEVRCGDAPPVGGRLAVLPVPALRDVHCELRWPAYTGRCETAHGDGHVEAPGPLASGSAGGTVATITAEANLPIASARMVFEHSPPVLMRVDGPWMSAAFEVKRDDRYRIVCRGHHEAIHFESVVYDVRATTDQPPRVRLSIPTGRVELPANQSRRLAGEASDDFGLAGVTLICRNGSRERRVTLATLPAPGAVARPLEAMLAASELGRPGDQLTCHLEARDHCPPSGQVARSEPFELIITEAIETPTSETSEGRDGPLPAASEEPATDGAQDSATETNDAGGRAGEEPSQTGQQGSQPAGGADTQAPGEPPQSPQSQQGGSADEAQSRVADELAEMARQDTEKLDVLSRALGDGEESGEGTKEGESSAAGAEGESAEAPQGQSAEQGEPGGEQGPTGEGEVQESGADGSPPDAAGQAGDQPGDADQPGLQPGPGGDGEAPELAGEGELQRELDLGAPAPPDRYERLESIGRIIDETQRRLRAGKVDEALLEELDMTPAELGSFCRKYEVLLAEMPRYASGRRDTIPAQSLGTLETQEGRDATVAGAEGTETLTPDEMRGLRDPRRRKVAPEYRQVVDDYFRAVSE